HKNSLIFTLCSILCSHIILFFVSTLFPTHYLFCFQDYSSVRQPSASVCSLAREVGSCYEWTSRFYFDSSSDSCSQFWFGGCEGNGNNFVSMEECERSCKASARGLAPRESTSRRVISGVRSYRMRSRA
uniref:BPTI/Kunitz inhibitor domain-containing protein n=1 Tax=Cyprinus carpio TaxID=7962 RepID=A0A8C2EAR3_CYPCA